MTDTTATVHPHPAFDNRVSRDLGVPIPIVQAPMGWIARSQLASAVSRAGACGIIFSGDLFHLFVCYEIVAVASYGLAASARAFNVRPIEAIR